MSYDLYFRPDAGPVIREDVLGYFLDRRNYSIEKDQIMYENDVTGVYFMFGLGDGGAEAEEDEGRDGVVLSVNLYRPSYFIREAEFEAQAFVQHFGWTVFDPQTHGMGKGDYRGDKLISGYDAANEVAYSMIIGGRLLPGNDVLTLPTAELTRIWQWNYGVRARQLKLGEVKFVPRIMFALLDGRLSTMAVWADAISAELPMVDHFLVVREELAPRRLFKKAADRVWLAWSDAVRILERHGVRLPDGAISLSYGLPEREVVDLIRSLKPEERQITGVAADRVLDRELVERALANS